MSSLFNFDFKPTYVDRYAGTSNYDKYRKMATKSNVGMIVDGFTPFSRAKRAVNPVKTMISVDDSNIANSPDQAICLSSTTSGKKNNIIINNDLLTNQMNNIVKEDKQYEFFNQQLKYSYGVHANKTRAAKFVSNFIGKVPTNYLDIIESAHNMMKATVNGYMPDYKDTLSSVENNESDCNLIEFINDLVNKTDKSSIISSINASNRSSANFTSLEEELEKLIEEDIRDGHDDEVLPSSIEIVPVFRAYEKHEDNPEDDKSAKEACSVGNGAVTYDESPSFSENPTQKDKKWEINNDTLESDGFSEVDDRYFFTARSYEQEERDFSKYDHLIDALYESLIGRDGKKNSQSPSKKLNKRNISSGLSENIYVSKDPIGGKKLNVNIIIDTSGSMSGDYIDSAVYILYVFNELSRRGVVSGNVMLSASSASGMWKMPMNEDKLKTIAAHNGGEGFRRTMAIRWKELKETDFNIAITDGMLTDGHIDLEEFESNDISVTGMYVSKELDKKELINYTNGLKEWFSKSIVRTSVEEAIYSIVDSGTLHLGSKNEH